MQNIYYALGATIEAQYFDVGKLLKEQINAAVFKAKSRRSKQSKLKHRIAAKVLKNLQTNSAAKEFYKVLQAWSRGAGISELDAVILLADNTSGCQTMMARYGSGIALFHTEEDFDNIKGRMTPPQIIAFKFGRIYKYTILYNDLMPGAGLFGWEENKAIAVDSLFLSEKGIEKIAKPMLANIVAWMIWRMDPKQADEQKILKMIVKLGLSIDGYAVNIVKKVGRRIEAFKLTFTRDEGHVERVGSQAGNYLRQVNVIEPMYHYHELPIAKWRTPPINMYKGGWKTFMSRLTTFDKYAKKYNTFAQQKLKFPKKTHQLIQKVIYEKLKKDYINNDLGAVCVALIDKLGTSTSIQLVRDSKKISVKLFV